MNVKKNDECKTARNTSPKYVPLLHLHMSIFAAGIKKIIFSYLYVRISGYMGAAGP